MQRALHLAAPATVPEYSHAPGPALAGAGDDQSPSERRRFTRWPVCRSTALSGNGLTQPCLILNFSPGGAKISHSTTLAIGSPVTLRLHDRAWYCGVVAWRSGRIMGLEFKDVPKQVAQYIEQCLSEMCLAS